MCLQAWGSSATAAIEQASRIFAQYLIIGAHNSILPKIDMATGLLL
jgi:hypothetical protein